MATAVGFPPPSIPPVTLNASRSPLQGSHAVNATPKKRVDASPAPSLPRTPLHSCKKRNAFCPPLMHNCSALVCTTRRLRAPSSPANLQKQVHHHRHSAADALHPKSSRCNPLWKTSPAHCFSHTMPFLSHKNPQQVLCCLSSNVLYQTAANSIILVTII